MKRETDILGGLKMLELGDGDSFSLVCIYNMSNRRSDVSGAQPLLVTEEGSAILPIAPKRSLSGEETDRAPFDRLVR